MKYSIKNHKLINTNTNFDQSPNHGGDLLKNLDTIVIHFTAGSSRSSAVNTFKNPNSKVSAHLVIGRDEQITQLVSFDTIAFHAGKSNHLKRKGINKYAIGIEIDNAGLLELKNKKYVSWFGKTYKKEEVLKAKHRNLDTEKNWHKYTEWQIDQCFEICKLLIETYNIKYILGHEEISPSRKIDPGPAFPLDDLREMLLGNVEN